LKIKRKSAQDFFLITNQKMENPPTPTTATEPTVIPATAPPESPSESSTGVVSAEVVSAGFVVSTGFVVSSGSTPRAGITSVSV